jgi:hypothetical protein
LVTLPPSNSAESTATMRTRVWLFYRRQKPRVDGLVIGAAGVGFLVWAGVLSTSMSPPSTPELIVLLAAGAVLQAWAGATFGRIGRVDAEKAMSAVRRLFTLGLTIRALRAELRESIKANDATGHRDAVIRADEAMSAVGYHLTDAIADWTDVHREALAGMMERLAQQSQALMRNEEGSDD